MKRNNLWLSPKAAAASRYGTLLNCCDLWCEDSSTGKQYFVFMVRTGPADGANYRVFALYGPGRSPTSQTADITKGPEDLKKATKAYALQIRKKVYGKSGGMSIYRPRDAMSAAEVAIMAGVRTPDILEAIAKDDWATLRALQNGVSDEPFLLALAENPDSLAAALIAKPEIADNKQVLENAIKCPMAAAVILASTSCRDSRLISAVQQDERAAQYAVQNCKDNLGIRVTVAAAGIGPASRKSQDADDARER